MYVITSFLNQLSKSEYNSLKNERFIYLFAMWSIVVESWKHKESQSSINTGNSGPGLIHDYGIKLNPQLHALMEAAHPETPLNIDMGGYL